MGKTVGLISRRSISWAGPSAVTTSLKDASPTTISPHRCSRARGEWRPSRIRRQPQSQAPRDGLNRGHVEERFERFQAPQDEPREAGFDKNCGLTEPCLTKTNLSLV